MRSLIILEVEHDETTNGLAGLLMDVTSVDTDHWNCDITNYTVRVDVPDCFRLET